MPITTVVLTTISVMKMESTSLHNENTRTSISLYFSYLLWHKNNDIQYKYAHTLDTHT